MSETRLEYILTHGYKADMIDYLKSNPDDLDELISLSLLDKQPYSWRAAWLLCSYVKKNDPLIIPHINTIVEMLPTVSDSQKREFLTILRKMDLPEDLEGIIFDHCVNIWEDITKQGSVRINALRLIVKIMEKHPDLKNEMSFLLQSHYTDQLSPGIKHSIKILMQ